jgi:hypothetical protein
MRALVHPYPTHTHTHTHIYTHTYTHTHTHTHTYTHTHIHTHTHTYTHTHSHTHTQKYVTLFTFLLQQRFQGRTSVLSVLFSNYSLSTYPRSCYHIQNLTRYLDSPIYIPANGQSSEAASIYSCIRVVLSFGFMVVLYAISCDYPQ